MYLFLTYLRAFSNPTPPLCFAFFKRPSELTPFGVAAHVPKLGVCPLFAAARKVVSTCLRPERASADCRLRASFPRPSLVPNAHADLQLPLIANTICLCLCLCLCLRLSLSLSLSCRPSSEVAKNGTLNETLARKTGWGWVVRKLLYTSGRGRSFPRSFVQLFFFFRKRKGGL